MRGLEANGFPVVVMAPQRQQAGDLTADGMTASTLALVLQKRTLPRHVVVLLDEAGQVGARQMRELAALVDSYDGRLILSGDTRQHGPVEASDILRAIEKHAGIKPAVLRGIRRQNPDLATSDSERAFIIGYRCAVKAASDGKAEESFDQLDRLGCIREAPAAVRHHLLAAEYLASLERKEKALVVAQTWDEVTAVNDSIRSALRQRGQLGDNTTIKTLRAVDLTEAEKQDARYYRVGQVAYVQKRYGRYVRGDCCRVLGATEKGVVLEKNGRRSTMNFKYVGRLVITEEREMEVAPGDRLQLKFNGKSRDGRSLANGELVTVRTVGTDGSIEVEDTRGQPKILSFEPAAVQPGLRSHFLRLTGKDGGRGSVRRLRMPRRDDLGTVVRDDLPRSKTGCGVHGKQSRPPRCCRSLRSEGPRPRFERGPRRRGASSRRAYSPFAGAR